jgi:hypothetical protein
MYQVISAELCHKLAAERHREVERTAHVARHAREARQARRRQRHEQRAHRHRRRSAG